MPTRLSDTLLRSGCAVIVVGLGVGCATMPTANAAACREVRNSSGVNYWFWQGYSGVEDTIEEGLAVTGHLSTDPSVCLRVLRSELNEPSARTQGYKLAVLEWFKRLPVNLEQPPHDADDLTARQHLRALTGQEFSSREQWTHWWVDNNDYLRWSDTAGRLVVDEEAKRARAPIAEAVQEITPTYYWYLQARDWLKEVHEAGESISGQAWTEHGYTKFRVAKSVLSDRAAKEQGYKDAVRAYIVTDAASPTVTGAAAEKFMTRLRELTDENFREREEWLQWWTENADRLALSEDGQRLVVRLR